MTSTSAGATQSCPPTTFLSSASRTTITTEHLALIGFAARLGTKINNDATSNSEDSKSVRDEAKLLMSLLMGKKASEILSEEIGENNHGHEGGAGDNNASRKSKSRPKDRDMGNFSFTFPVLSLQPSAPAHTVQSDESGRQEASTPPPTSEDNEDSSHQDGVDSSPTPSTLLGRTQCVHDKDDIRESSEAMARNVLESFGAALVWRAKTWIKSLAHVLALKEQCKSLENSEGANDDNDGDDAGNEGEEEGQTDMDSDLMNSREMQIIEAIVRSSEEVTVVNITTHFRVMPGAVSAEEADQLEPSLKKRKSDCSQEETEYKVTHKLMFEGTVSMTSNDGGRYKIVKLQAPGLIEGSFSKEGKQSEGEETLRAVSITLDTNALALSLERQSRLVVRRAAEAALMAASGMEYDTNHVHHSVISPRYVLMSPMQPHHFPSRDHDTDGIRSVSASPSIPFQPVDDESTTEEKRASPGFVSSSEDGGAGSDSSAVTTPSLAPQKAPSSESPHPQSPSFPALLAVANAELDEPEI